MTLSVPLEHATPHASAVFSPVKETCLAIGGCGSLRLNNRHGAPGRRAEPTSFLGLVWEAPSPKDPAPGHVSPPPPHPAASSSGLPAECAREGEGGFKGGHPSEGPATAPFALRVSWWFMRVLG